MKIFLFICMLTLVACSETEPAPINTNDMGSDQDIDVQIETDVGPNIPEACTQDTDCENGTECLNQLCMGPLQCSHMQEPDFVWDGCNDQRVYEAKCLDFQGYSECTCTINDVETKSIRVEIEFEIDVDWVNEQCEWDNPSEPIFIADEDIYTLPEGTACESRAGCMANQECQNNICTDHISCKNGGLAVTVDGTLYLWTDCSDEKEYEISCVEELVNEMTQTTCVCKVDEVETKTFEKEGQIYVDYSLANSECEWLLPK